MVNGVLVTRGARLLQQFPEFRGERPGAKDVCGVSAGKLGHGYSEHGSDSNRAAIWHGC